LGSLVTRILRFLVLVIDVFSPLLEEYR